jgi:biotin carboxylase
VLGACNLYGEPNEAVVVQRRLHGVEYYVNTVSYRDAHRVAEMWQYTKRRSAGGSPLYDYEHPIEASDPRAPGLREFVFAVLDALGVGTSAAHAEVMVTADGPVLIEVASRLGGATVPALVEKYAGVSQVTLFAESLLDPRRLAGFDDRADRWSATVRSVSFINHVAGTVRSDAWLDRVLSLPTAAEVSVHLSVGEHLVRTTDLINSPGFVYLISDDADAVRRDYDTLRAWERAGLYVS